MTLHFNLKSMAENTELKLVQQQANNITRQIATLKSDTENAVQANRKSYEACVQAGESLLSDISASGMNDALDEKAAEFIKKAKLTEKAMTEKRKGVTQVFDIVRWRTLSLSRTPILLSIRFKRSAMSMLPTS